MFNHLSHGDHVRARGLVAIADVFFFLSIAVSWWRYGRRLFAAGDKEDVSHLQMTYIISPEDRPLLLPAPGGANSDGNAESDVSNEENIYVSAEELRKEKKRLYMVGYRKGRGKKLHLRPQPLLILLKVT
ncbi:hypothetical protein EJB05_21368 [Eragrostis curvula]|uniref:Uncharacterized protein n=1 Tax=Eragrostis curvula TaxID=38414 RepID=A0A5J9V0R2_9POAL|nr:hypothetical protein EJB05_21368 [Eragrostis curvula]